MTQDPRTRSSRSQSRPDAWPRWTIIVVPLLVVVVVAGLWWAIFSPVDSTKKTEEATPAVVEQAALPSPTALVAEPGDALPTATPESGALLPTVNLTPGADDPTPTPAVTPGAVPEAFEVGNTVVVTGTEGSGLRMRFGPGTGYDRVKTLQEGAVVEILGGPTPKDDFDWWQIRDASGAEGFVAGDYLIKQE